MEQEGFIATESRLSDAGAAVLYAAAVVQYARDCQAALSWINWPDDGEALDDLTGSREILAFLCANAGLDAEYTTRKILELCHRRR